MITRLLVLAMVLAITLAVTTPAFAQFDWKDFNTAKPIPGYPEFEITDKGVIIQGDLAWGKCSTLLQMQQRNGLPRDEDMVEAARACEAAGYSAPLTNTGGIPVILVPIALLVLGGLLIRASTAQ